MKIIEKHNDRLIINLFGIKLKFHKPLKYNDLMKNLLYELADKRTLENIMLPQVLTLEDSLQILLNSEKSLARFGDGEVKLMMMEGINFQKADEKLATKLIEVLQNKNPNLLVGLPDVFGYCYSEYFRRVMINCREFLYQYIDFSSQYCDSMLTRQSKFNCEQEGIEYYDKIKNLWKNRDIVIVEGEGSRLGIGNDLFSGANSIIRILCPIKNAFSKYDRILSECKQISKDKLFILALGPTATVLAYDLSNLGYRALDVGHIDLMYEYFLRKEIKNVKIDGKIVLNSERHRFNIKPCKDKNYYQQIIAEII